MKTAYLILKKGFEYDDNIYNSTEEGGNPSLIVFSREEAKQKVNDLNIKEFKQCSLSEYTYEMEDILNVEISEYDEFNESLDTKYGKPEAKNKWESTENRLHPMANEEECKKYSEMVSLNFYEYTETDIDVESLRNKQLESLLDSKN
jgi:hypothetical protein